MRRPNIERMRRYSGRSAGVPKPTRATAAFDDERIERALEDPKRYFAEARARAEQEIRAEMSRERKSPQRIRDHLGVPLLDDGTCGTSH